ncbi:hypothetical protein VTK73DRAFT_513 [Phialemonium thermophilum]|uniref:C2H2-type domain-containing protein n=1 Tax=Phialemonium thermophilum TaxID=223376 RepID=A0ABR3Y3Y4_9PEZI
MDANGVKCPECEEMFQDHMALISHLKDEFQAGHGHRHCYICGRYFHTEEGLRRHVAEFHATAQDLNCPGCDRKFARLGTLMEHIETDACKVFDSTKLAMRRDQKLVFARALQARHRGDFFDPHAASTPIQSSGSGFGRYLNPAMAVSQQGHGATIPKAEATVRPNPLLFETRPAGFSGAAETPYSQLEKPSDLTSGQQEQDLTAKQASTDPTRLPNQHRDLHNPKRPGFDPAKYYVTYIKKYQCPHQTCGKCLPTAAGFINHLESPAHSSKRYHCPSCYRWFNSVAALTQHCESQGVRCNIRASDNFRPFLDQLTAGIADVRGVHDKDGTNRYVVPKDVSRTFDSKGAEQHVAVQTWAGEEQNNDGESGKTSVN